MAAPAPGFRQGEFQKAIDDSTAALKIDSSEDAYGVRGDALRKLGQFAKAVADYDAAQRIDSDVAETWLAYSRNCGKPAARANPTGPSNGRTNSSRSTCRESRRPLFHARSDRGEAHLGPIC